MRRVAALLALAPVLAGCGDGSAAMNDGDCLARFSWEGVEYQPWVTADDEVVGERLADSEVRGCADDPAIPATVHRVRGLKPEVAVAVHDSGGSTTVWGRAGYILESARHPFHDAVYHGPDKPDYTGEHRCGPRRKLRVRVTQAPVTPENGLPLTVRAADQDFLVRGGVLGAVYVEPDAKITGAERHGIPFVTVGDELMLSVRECVATSEAGPGMAGLRSVVADELRGVR
jgi:hypothetical protein